MTKHLKPEQLNKQLTGGWPVKIMSESYKHHQNLLNK